MAGFPATLYNYLEDGSQGKITSALAVTRKRQLWSENAYRDSFNAAFMGAAIPNQSTTEYSGGLIAMQGDKVTPITTKLPSTAITPSAGPPPEYSVSFSDEISHFPWRIKQYVRWLRQWWDSALVGHAMIISATTVSGSGIITVPDASLLTPLQGITGAGITAGSIILDIMPIDPDSSLPQPTKAVISQAATASATVAATLTGSNLVAEVWEDEFVQWAEEISFPT